MPVGAVYVGRPSKWGNHFTVPQTGSVAAAVAWYRGWLNCLPSWERDDYLAPLRGATALACWCPLSQPCHADALIELLAAEETP